MNTRSVNSAAGVILAALTENRTATGIALSLEAAGLLMSPEAAADMASVSTDAVGVAEQAVKELQREHELSAGVRQENVRLFLAWGSARMRARRKNEALKKLRARVAELETERHSTNESLSEAAEALRENRDRIAELERQIAAEECRCPEPAPLCEGCRCKCHAEQVEASADRLTRLFAPTQALREEPAAEVVPPRVQAMRALLDGQRAAVEDPHDGPLHHSYRVPRDLPQLGGAQ
ncbi:hypothetical protein ACWCQW_02825 [Streptomyces mirabilis]